MMESWSHAPVEGGEPLTQVSLEGIPVAWVDRILPQRPQLFLLMVGGISLGCWLLGYLLATDRSQFLRTKEWHAQLIYLPVHFITLRMFVTLYTRNFMAGIAHVTMPEKEARWRMYRVLGPIGLLAVLIAAPFCLRDLAELDGDKYRDSLVGPKKTIGATSDEARNLEGVFFLWPEGEHPLPDEVVRQAGGLEEEVHAIGLADLLMWGIWCLEWAINAYIWVLLLGFLILTMRVLRRYSFRDPVEIVLHEKHYRPFLLMSGQGASIVLGFAFFNALYVWYAQGTITDYIGMGVTIFLLVLGFVPPWLQLKANVEKVVNGEIYKLRENLIARHRRQADLEKHGQQGALDLGTRVDEALVMLRIDYLDRLYRQLGRNEAGVMLLKLMAPVSTIGFRFIRPFLGLP